MEQSCHLGHGLSELLPRLTTLLFPDSPCGWFRNTVWLKALRGTQLGFPVTPHELRHAHASLLLAGGADLQVVKERLGHTSITTTEKYPHTRPDAEDAALDVLLQQAPELHPGS